MSACADHVELCGFGVELGNLPHADIQVSDGKKSPALREVQALNLGKLAKKYALSPRQLCVSCYIFISN